MIGGDLSRFEFSGWNFLYDLNLVLDDIDRELRNGMLPNDSDPFGRRIFYLPGSNTAFRLSDYPGYRLDEYKGENSSLCRDFLQNDKCIEFLDGIPVYTDPRRVVRAFNKGKFVHEAWDDWTKFGNRGREKTDLDKLEYSESRFVEHLNIYFQSRLQCFYKSKHNKTTDEEFLQRANVYVEITLEHLRKRFSAVGIPCDIELNVTPLQVDKIQTDLLNTLASHEYLQMAK